MKINVQMSDQWYVPEYSENRANKEDEQCRFLLKALTYQERQDAILGNIIFENGESDQKSKVTAFANDNLLKAAILEVKNLSIVDPADGKEIECTVETLLKYAPSELRLELLRAVQDANFLNEGLLKN